MTAYFRAMPDLANIQKYNADFYISQQNNHPLNLAAWIINK
jgi:hypothetical protein